MPRARAGQPPRREPFQPPPPGTSPAPLLIRAPPPLPNLYQAWAPAQTQPRLPRSRWRAWAQAQTRPRLPRSRWRAWALAPTLLLLPQSQCPAWALAPTQPLPLASRCPAWAQAPTQPLPPASQCPAWAQALTLPPLPASRCPAWALVPTPPQPRSSQCPAWARALTQPLPPASQCPAWAQALTQPRPLFNRWRAWDRRRPRNHHHRLLRLLPHPLRRRHRNHRRPQATSAPTAALHWPRTRSSAACAERRYRGRPSRALVRFCRRGALVCSRAGSRWRRLRPWLWQLRSWPVSAWWPATMTRKPARSGPTTHR